MAKMLVVIDPQKGFDKPETVSGIKKLIELLKYVDTRTDFDVLTCYFKNKPESKFETYLNWRGFQNEDDTKPIASLESFLSKYPKFWHSTYNIFTQELCDHLRKQNVTDAYFAGFLTDVGILKASLDAFDLGYDVKVVADCCTTYHGVNNQKYAIDTLKHAIGKRNVINLSDLKKSMTNS